MSALVLIADDEEGILTTLSQILSDEGYETVTTTSGEEALHLYRERQPDVVFLDIWLPDWDGLETLQALRDFDPNAMVIMMSGHGTSETAVKSIKMGAHDYLEKPMSYDRTIQAVTEALEIRRQRSEAEGDLLEKNRERMVPISNLRPPPELALLETTDRPQKTIQEATVIYGLGLHSGGRTGMVIQPLPPEAGIHFVTLPGGVTMPAHVSSVAETSYATTLTKDGESIRTVEHLLSALHACGITNLLVKVHGEIPVLDGSSLAFLDHLESVGIVEQDAPVKEVMIDRRYEVADDDKYLSIEPSEVLRVSYELRYPPPIGDQFYEFSLDDCEAFREQIAPARTFGFMRDLKMINELGLGTGGRLDNFILVGEDNVINTDLRFPDEFVRHKILDIIGDIYLMGYPVRGKITARLTGHRDNIDLQRLILAENA
ncbi:MAG: UDP-3-O-acyl-N-acetylglucosamine deacetylase [Holophagae bacterium]|jgi:UDP-3-O-acyl N-acetylglucosamine deacetylase